MSPWLEKRSVLAAAGAATKATAKATARAVARSARGAFMGFLLWEGLDFERLAEGAIIPVTMTEPLYRDAPYERENAARVTAIDEHGIRLDRTVFYPRGGGQAGDAGALVLGDGRVLAIADTVKVEGDIVHVP